MGGTAPTGFQFTRTLDAGPGHCSVWLCRSFPPWISKRGKDDRCDSSARQAE